MKRKEELMHYIGLLRGLMKDDFRCEQEMKHALHELHSLMLAEKPERTMFVVEDSIDGLSKSTQMFLDILGADAKVVEKYLHGHNRIECSNSTVIIVNINNIDKNRFRGLTVDHLINNTFLPEIESKLGIKVR